MDQRSLEALSIELEPQHKIGPAKPHIAEQGLTAERLVEHHAIARVNGERFIVNPAIELDAMISTQAAGVVKLNVRCCQT